MAPFEWITPERSWSVVGLFVGVSLFVSGAIQLYLGAFDGAESAVVLFGVILYIVVGIVQVLLGIGWLFYRSRFRPAPSFSEVD